MKFTKGFLRVCKKVILKSVEVGFDIAGEKICGKSAWTKIKKILSPVVKELERRFPKWLKDPEETEKAANSLEKDKIFIDLLTSGLAKLDDGQGEILTAIARQSETLEQLGNIIHEGFAEAEKKHKASFERIQQEVQVIKSQLAEIHKITPEEQSHRSLAGSLSIIEIYNHAFGYQADAMKWLLSNKTDLASQRLIEGRAIIKEGFKRDPSNNYLLVAMGFIEKTQAQIAKLLYNQDEFIYSLEKAAKCFSKVLQQNPKDEGALNGIANVYLLNHDYDLAIQSGLLALQSNPMYGAAAWDLAIALEKKIKLEQIDSFLINQLISVYQKLLFIMPQQPETFSASDLKYVQDKLTNLNQINLNLSDQARSNQFKEHQKRKPCVVQIKRVLDGAFMGSGFFIDSTGSILTTSHVLRNENKFKAELYNGDVYDAVIEKNDPARELTLLRILDVKSKPLPIINNKSLNILEQVTVNGYSAESTWKILIGSMMGNYPASSKSREKIIINLENPPFGLSGAPLLDSNFNVIGILAGYIPTDQITLVIPGYIIYEFLERK